MQSKQQMVLTVLGSAGKVPNYLHSQCEIEEGCECIF